jgi:hypothetical protein
MLTATGLFADDSPTGVPADRTTLYGTIRYNDQPVLDAFVEVLIVPPEDDVLAEAWTGADGHFELTFSADGVDLPTRYAVRVSAPAGLRSASFQGGWLPAPASVQRDYDLMEVGEIIVPAENATIRSLTPLVAWSRSESASTYELQVLKRGSGQFFEVLYEIADLTCILYQLPPGVLEPRETYLIRAYGRNANGTLVLQCDGKLLETQ